MAKDYYEILGVPKSASAEEIKAAFRKKAHEHHPDKGGDSEKFKELNAAYQVLGNPEKRKQYDQFGPAFQQGQAGGFGGFQGGAGFDFEDLGDIFGGFGDIFGFGGRSSGRAPSRGRDLEMAVSLDFMDAVSGTEKELSFTKQAVCRHCSGQGAEPGSEVKTCGTCNGLGQVRRLQRTILGNIQTQSPCPDCAGEGRKFTQACRDCGGEGRKREAAKLKVKIPAGINSGESIRLTGQGEAGPKGAPAGDLYLRINLKEHARFRREGNDIKTEEEISIRQAALGDKIEVETVHGPLKLKVPEGTQPNTVFKLKDKGMPKLHGRGTGDHYVKLKVVIPTRLDKKQKKILEELGI